MVKPKINQKRRSSKTPSVGLAASHNEGGLDKTVPAKPNQNQVAIKKPEIAQDVVEKLKVVNELRSKNLLAGARDRLQEVLNLHPDWQPARRELILLYLSAENFVDAEKTINEEIEKYPQDPWYLIIMARLKSLTKLPLEEIKFINSALAIKFDEPLARRLFEVQRDSNDLKGALETVLLLRKHRDTVDLEVAQSKLLNLIGDKSEALNIALSLFSKRPIPVGSIETIMAAYLGDENSPQKIVDLFEPILNEDYAESVKPFLLHALSRAFHRMDHNQKAIDSLEQALAINPKQAMWWYDLSLVERQSGKLEKSQESLEKSLEIDRLNPVALRVHGVEHKYVYGDDAFKRINFAAANYDKFQDERKVELGFALAKAYEDVGELDTAYKYYENAGRLQTSLTPYQHGSAVSVLAMTRDRVGRPTYENFPLPRCNSDKPLFVLGMPRSGTSLTEQVLSSHPDIFGAGELKLLHRVLDNISINGKLINTRGDVGNIHTFIPGFDLEDCRAKSFEERGELYVKGVELLAAAAGKPDAKRIIDKMPGNYFWTGVIPFILPHAKIVHTQRHPLDNCLSIYRIFFPDGMPWSYDLANLGKVYREYYMHMNYWEKNLPDGQMLTVNYEVMVADFESQAKRLVEHVGLPWDVACLKFHENDRPVKTASLTQVRKPIYSSSVGRWKKYEDYLKPLIRELGPVINDYDEKIERMLSKVKRDN